MQIRISYSIIWLWLAGEYEAAIMALQRKWREPSEAMAYGIKMHKEWEEEVGKTGKLPDIFGGTKLVNPQMEIRREKKLTSWLTLVGVVDVQHGENGEFLIDYKTGVSRASGYANGYQHRVYKLLFPEALTMDYLQYNQHEDSVGFQRVHLTDITTDEGLEIVVSVACDIRATLENMGIEL